MLTRSIQLFLLGTGALLPLLGLAVVVWRRYYRDDAANNARRVVKNSTLPIAANLINQVINFGFAVIMLRLLGPEGNGAYAFAALIVTQYFLTISNWGLNDLTVREVASDQSQAARLFSITLLLRCGVAALLIPVAAGLVGVYALIDRPLSPATVAALALLTLHLFPAALASACSASFQAFQRMEVPALIALLTNITRVLIGALVLVVVPQDQRVVALAGVALAMTVLNGLIFLALQERLLFRVRLTWEWPTGRRLLGEAFPLLLNSLLLAVFFRFDYVILQAIDGPGAVGTYDAAYKLINMTTIIPGYFVGALFPLLARSAFSDRPAFERTYRHALTFLQMLAWPVAVGVSLLAGPIIWLQAGDQYLPGAANALAILIWFLPLSYANGVVQYVLIALRRQHTITVAFGIAAAFNLIANVLLIPSFGYLAAAALTVVTEVALMVPLLRVVRAESIRPALLASMWRPALAALLMGLVMVAFEQVSLVAAALVAAPTYLAALWLLGGFGSEERALARRVLGRS